MLKAVAGSGVDLAADITIGSSVITGGTNTRVLFDDNGVVGEDAGFTYIKATDALVIVGPITGASFNGLVVTTSTGTLTVANGKTLTVSNSGTLAGGDAFVLAIAAAKTFTVSNSLTLAGTDSTAMTFPGTSSTVLTTGNTALITKGYTVTPNNIGTVSSGTTTPAAADGNYQYLTNNGAFTLAAPAADCAIDLLVTNGASAGAITFSGFTVGSSTGSALTTTNTNKFIISIRRINSVATYSVYALQ